MRNIIYIIFLLLITLSLTPHTTQAKGILETLLPDTKNCNYVDDKKYQTFANIDENFPGAKELLGLKASKSSSTVYCVDIAEGTEGMVKMVYTAAMSLIILLTVVSISISGIQYIVEESIDKKGIAKKRLTNSVFALILGVGAYTVMNTINKQLVQFNFEPKIIDKENLIDKGNTDTINAFNTNKEVSISSDSIDAVFNRPTNTISENLFSNTNIGGDFLSTANSFGQDISTPQTGLRAVIYTINNVSQKNASADGTINLNGQQYYFRSGGGGNGFLPLGTYTVTIGDFEDQYKGQTIKGLRSTPPTMLVDGFGYSFNLNNTYDPRTGVNRDELRIHPDGGNPGTIGCIGIQGSRDVQEKFFFTLYNIIKQNGGVYKLTVLKSSN